MKKQIKNLTKEEVEKICYSRYICNDCPLDIPSSPRKYCMKNIIDMYKEALEKEIEVEEEQK